MSIELAKLLGAATTGPGGLLTGAAIKGVSALAQGLQRRRAAKADAAADRAYARELESIGERDFSSSDAAIRAQTDDVLRQTEAKEKEARDANKRLRASGVRVAPTTSDSTARAAKARRSALAADRALAGERRESAEKVADVKYSGKKNEIATRLANRQQATKDVENIVGGIVAGTSARADAKAKRAHESKLWSQRYPGKVE